MKTYTVTVEPRNAGHRALLEIEPTGRWAIAYHPTDPQKALQCLWRKCHRRPDLFRAPALRAIEKKIKEIKK